MTYQRQPGLRLGWNQKEGPAGTPGEVLSCPSLKEVKNSKEDVRHKPQIASSISKPSSPSVTLWNPVYILQASHVLHVPCLSK